MHTKLNKTDSSESKPKRLVYQEKIINAQESETGTEEMMMRVVKMVLLAKENGGEREFGTNEIPEIIGFDRQSFFRNTSNPEDKNPYTPAAAQEILERFWNTPVNVRDISRVKIHTDGSIEVSVRMNGNLQGILIEKTNPLVKAIEWYEQNRKRVLSRMSQAHQTSVALIEENVKNSRPKPKSQPQAHSPKSPEYPTGSTIDQATIDAAAREASTSTGDINEVLRRENFMKVVNYVAETVGIPASALLSVMFTETNFKFDPNLEGPGGEYGLGQFMPGTWKTIRKTSAFKSCVSKFGINPAKVERAENVLADITGIAVLLKRGLNKDINHTTQLTEGDLEQMRFHYHVPGYRRAIMEGRGSEAYIAKARAFVEANKARKAQKYGPDGVGQYGYKYYADRALDYQKAWEAKFAGRSNITKENPKGITTKEASVGAATSTLERPTGQGNPNAKDDTEKGESTNIHENTHQAEPNRVDAKETKPSTEIKSEEFKSASGKPGKYHLKSGQKRWIVGTSSVVGNMFGTGKKYDGMATSLTTDSGYYGVSSEHPDKFLNGFKKEVEPQIKDFKMPGEIIIVGLGYMGAMARKTAEQIMASYAEIEAYYKLKGVGSVKFTTVQPYATGAKLNTINEFNKRLQAKYGDRVINTLDLSTDENKHTDGIHLNDEATKTLAARLEGKEEK